MIKSSLRLEVSQRQFDLTLHTGVQLHPISIFLMEVKFPAMKLVLEGKGKFFSRVKKCDLPSCLKKLTLVTKAAWAAKESGVWAPR